MATASPVPSSPPDDKGLLVAIVGALFREPLALK